MSRLFSPQILELAGKGDIGESFDIDLRFIADSPTPVSQFAFCARVHRQTKQFS